MVFGFDLNHLFSFPVQDDEARKHFLIGCVIILAGFVIPILPWIFVIGYCAILIRQILNGEKPHMVPWTNWEALLKDGVRLWGLRLIYSLPLLILFLPLILAAMAFPVAVGWSQANNSQIPDVVPLLFVVIIVVTSLLILPISLMVTWIVPAAEIHMIAKDEFAAGFRVKEWWPIFKRNWGGFLVALAILYGISLVLSIIMQILFFTVILACLFPLFMPVITTYSMLLQYAAFAQAYKEGRDRPQLPAAVG